MLLAGLNKSSSRILSIDALRGFDMFWIIGGSEFVLAFLALNNSAWAQRLATGFRHSGWNGFTFYDSLFYGNFYGFIDKHVQEVYIF